MEIVVFVAPGCSWCEKVEDWLREAGTPFELLDVTADWRSLRLLLRAAGRPIVPTVVAYGHVMVGFDPDRLAHMLEAAQARADAYESNEAEQERELMESDEAVRQALGEEPDLGMAEVEAMDSPGEHDERERSET